MKTITFDCLGLLKSSLKRLLITFVAIHIVVFVASAQKTSTGSGAWNVGATWTPAGVPGTGDDVTVLAGHVITVPATAVCRKIFISGTVNMTGTGITLEISNNSAAGATNGIQLNAGGILNIGATNIVYFSNGQASGIVNNGGTIVSTGVNGADGGTIRLNTNSGGEFRISGTSATTVNNLQFLGNANFNINTAGMRINGTVSIVDNNWSSSASPNSPIYGPGATLSINNNGQGISGGPGPLNGPLSKMWTVTTGTIGTTPGYPNNVTLMNIGTSVTGVTLPAPIGNVNVGWVPTGAMGLNGTLRIGDGTTNGLASLHAVTSFNCGGIIVDHNSTLISPAAGVSFIDRGNFILQGATTGLFHNYGATLNMGGSATIGSPQIMSTTAASGILPLTNLTVSNGTYVRVDDDVTIGGILTLTSGYIGTSAANSLTVLNSATSSIVGGSATAYVDGPLSWNLPSTTSGNYVFPIGHLTGGAYLPLTMSSANSIAGTTATATAFNVNSNGIPGPTVTTISPTEYWSVSTSSPFSSGAQITVQRPTAVAPNNALASSGSSNGVYNAIGGSPNTGTPGIITNGGIGSGSPIFIVMVQAPLGVVKIGGTNAGLDASCNPTSGSIIAGGTGGTAPYTYSMTSATGPWGGGTFGPLAKGSHRVWVRDNTGAVATALLEVLGSLLINGNNQDVDICSGETTTLSATNLLNSAATFTWTSVPAGSYPSTASINVTPSVPTTYTVSSTIYNPTGNRITNGSFETGVNGGSFTSDYIDRTGMGQYADTPDGNGYYMIADQGTDLCQWFSISGPANAPALSPQSGTYYLVGDGANAAENVWVQNVTGLTAGVTYQFSFYYAAASVSSPRAQIQTSFTNPASTPGTITASNGSAWTQVSYLFTPSGTTTTITLRNLTTGIPGNDFYIDNIQLLPPCIMTESIDVTLNCTLPVELLDFNAVRQGEGALLTWETLVEKNSSHFIIEKSIDGISFASIGKVNAAGNSDGYLSYSFIDPSIDNGITYYRLIQYDLNGDYTYSEIRAVTKNVGSADVQIVPNPNNGMFMILFNQNGDYKTYVSIVNTLGQTVYTSAELLTNSLTVDISALASGVYYLQVNTAEGTIVKKIVKE